MTLSWSQKILDLNKSCMVLQIRQKKTKKINMYDFVLVHDCTPEQNGSPCFSSIVRPCKWPSLSRKIVKIQKMGYYGNVTSHFSSL